MKNTIFSDCLRYAIQLNPRHPEAKAGYHHFSFVVQNNQIIAYGVNRSTGLNKKINSYNNVRNSKLLCWYKPHQKLHSENAAYFKARGILNKQKHFEVLNIRLGKNNSLKMSRPCQCCIRFLRGLGCSTIWFSTGLDDYQWAKISLGN